MTKCKICNVGRVYKSGFCVRCFNNVFPVCEGEDKMLARMEAGIERGERGESDWARTPGAWYD